MKAKVACLNSIASWPKSSASMPGPICLKLSRQAGHGLGRGTRERIDPVRYISNDSSGKMGYAMAQAADWLGRDRHLGLHHPKASCHQKASKSKR